MVKEKNTNLSVVLRIIVFLHRFSKRYFVTGGNEGLASQKRKLSR